MADRRTLVVLALLAVGCASPPPPEFGIMTFNIRYGTADDGPNAWTLRRDLVVATIAAERPDVLGLQEALRFQLDELRAALPGYAELGVGRDDGGTAGEYAAILYRPDRVTIEATGTFWLSDTPEVPGSATWGNRITRICTWARIRERAAGSRFVLFNLHLDHESQPSRERSVQLILARVDRLAAGLPVLLTGDFNAGEDNPAVAAVRAAGFVDTYRAVDPDPSGDGTFGGFAGDSSGAKIDFVFARGPWRVRTADILRRRGGTRDPSDHFPVTARLVLEQR
jgi:endonuclease/exonuclease/phosphatase family metal-dependent hydrolase